MRRRAGRELFALGALASATACAAVTGLSDYDVVADAADGAVPDTAPPPTATGTNIPPPPPAEDGGPDATADVAVSPDADAAPPSACPAGTVCDVLTSSDVLDIAIDGNSIFWVEKTNTTAQIRTRALDNTATTTLAAGEASVVGIAANAQSVYWTANGTLRRIARIGGIAVSSQAVRGGCLQWSITRLIAAEPSTGHLWSFDESGLTKTQLVETAVDPWGVTATPDGGAVFYTNYDLTDGKIRRDSDQTPNPTLVTNERGPRCMETDGTKLYWANEASGELRSSTLTGGSVQTEVAGQPLIHGLALSPSGELYWSWSGGIRKRGK